MTEWSGGYVSDVGYTYGYYAELNPVRATLPFLSAGLKPRDATVACEIGFGQGMSVNLHAMAGGAKWYGTDFNPDQALFAEDVAQKLKGKPRLFDEAFADFCTRSDLPEFDFIGLHGIWSWISDSNRGVITDFLRRKLKVGGVVYVSYNTMPGWASMVPVRQMLTQHGQFMASRAQNTISKVNESLKFVERLFLTSPKFAGANPGIRERFEQLQKLGRNYLAHEYFNLDWSPIPFVAMAEQMGDAKLRYACSATYLEHIEALNLSQEQLSFLQEVPDPVFRQSVRDFMLNQQFRRDYWVKGVEPLSALEQQREWKKQRVALSVPRESVTMTVACPNGKAKLQPSVYEPLLDALADHKLHEVAELEQLVDKQKVSTGQLQQALMLLCGRGDLALAQNENVSKAVRTACHAGNVQLMEASRYSDRYSYLGSPVTGGGISVSRFHQLFLLASANGKKKPIEWAEFAWNFLAAQNQRLTLQGVLLETPEQNLKQLCAEAELFEKKQLPIYRALDLVDA